VQTHGVSRRGLVVLEIAPLAATDEHERQDPCRQRGPLEHRDRQPRSHPGHRHYGVSASGHQFFIIIIQIQQGLCVSGHSLLFTNLGKKKAPNPQKKKKKKTPTSGAGRSRTPARHATSRRHPRPPRPRVTERDRGERRAEHCDRRARAELRHDGLVCPQPRRAVRQPVLREGPARGLDGENGKPRGARGNAQGRREGREQRKGARPREKRRMGLLGRVVGLA
jgi:hypothetical protein